jgi:hypothetical protein
VGGFIKYDYQHFEDDIMKFQHELDNLARLFEKVLKAMKQGNNTLFDEFAKCDTAQSGTISETMFKKSFERVKVLRQEEMNTVIFLYDYSEGTGSIHYRDLKADYIKYLNEFNENFLELTSTERNQARGGLQLFADKKLYIMLQTYFVRNGWLDQRGFFAEYGMNDKKSTISRYGFQRAMYDIIPNLTTVDYDNLEKDCEEENQLSISKFKEALSTPFLSRNRQQGRQGVRPSHDQLLLQPSQVPHLVLHQPRPRGQKRGLRTLLLQVFLSEVYP